jgi:hypothetical protein
VKEAERTLETKRAIVEAAWKDNLTGFSQYLSDKKTIEDYAQGFHCGDAHHPGYHQGAQSDFDRQNQHILHRSDK